jgi:chorismate synthase
MTQRKEPDAVRIASGVMPDGDGVQRTTGAPIALLVDNVDARSNLPPPAARLNL